MAQKPQQDNKWYSSYDRETQAMSITFPNGRSYSLDGVPPDLYEQWLQAESKPRFWNDYLRGRY